MYKFYESDLCRQMSDTIILNGKSDSTRLAYLRQVRVLSDFYNKSPDLITEDEIRQFLIHQKTKVGWSASSMRNAHGALRYFYRKVLDKDWRTLSLIKTENESRLPSVLSVAEVRRILAKVTRFHNYAYFVAVYSTRVRLHEGLFSRCPTLTRIECSSMCIAEKGRRTGTFHFLMILYYCYVDTGQPTAIPNGFFLQSVVAEQEQPQPLNR